MYFGCMERRTLLKTINAPERYLRDLTRLGTPMVSAPSQEVALQTIQEGMGKFLLQAARGLSFWNSFGQLASKKEGG